MGQTGHGQIGRKFKGARCSSADKTASKGGNINIGLIEYFTKTLLKKIKKNPKHVDTVVSSIQPLPLPVSK